MYLLFTYVPNQIVTDFVVFTSESKWLHTFIHKSSPFLNNWFDNFLPFFPLVSPLPPSSEFKYFPVQTTAIGTGCGAPIPRSVRLCF